MNNYLIANYHTHTTRCMHAWGTEREYIEAAIKAGIQVLGFADHGPIPFTDGYVSGMRMPMEDAKGYVDTLKALREEYAGRIEIKIGFEAEYMADMYPCQMEAYRKLGIDYLIMGQHFWKSEKDGPYAGSKTEDENRLMGYVDSVIEGMKTGSYRYLAHPDLINYVGDDAVYEREIRRMCQELKNMGIPLEINLLGLAEKKHYPRERFWEIAGSVGNQVIIGIDAHWKEQIGDMAAYGAAMELVGKYGLQLVEKLEM